MAKLVYGMNLSLDGYADHQAFGPGPVLFRHWIDRVRALSGSIYGRGMYEVMRVWDDELPGWGAAEREFAQAWRRQPKWVASRTLKSVGANAALLGDDLAAAVKELKAQHSGEIGVAGPKLAHSLGEMGLIDEYRLYYHPVVLGKGAPFFTGALPRLRLTATDRIDDDVIRLTYVPAGVAA